MSLKNNGFLNIGTYNDNSREYNIDARGKDLSSVLRAIDAEDVTPAEDLSSNSSESDSGSPILSIPEKNKYSQVRIYIRERCRFDEEFKKFCQERSLRDLCARLTDEFGWFVDEHSLGANLNRNR